MSRRIALFGANSRIAQDVARLYAKRGARLALIGRNPDKLAALAQELGPSVCLTVVQDFDRTEEAAACVDRVIAALGAIDVALIAHGLLGEQERSERELEVAEAIVRTNYLGAMALVIPLANHFEARGQGHLAVCSSVAAERGRPRNYTYAAAKSALNTYLEGVRSRLYARGVKVHVLKLGPVDTPMTLDHTKNALFSRPEDVARGIVRAIDENRFEAYVPGYWRLLMGIVRNVPEPLFQRVKSLSGR